MQATKSMNASDGVFSSPFDSLAPLRQHLPSASTSEISKGPGTATMSGMAKDDHERAWATKSTLSIRDKLEDNHDLSKTDELLSRMIHLQGEIIDLTYKVKFWTQGKEPG